MIKPNSRVNFNGNQQQTQKNINIERKPAKIVNRGFQDEQLQSKLLAKQLQKKVQIETQNKQKCLPNSQFLDKIPNEIFIYIFKFLPKSQYFSMRLVSKDFNDLSFQVIQTLHFPFEGDIPKEMVMNLLNRAKFVKKIIFGQFKHMNQSHFCDNVVQRHDKLEYIDFSHYNQLTNKIVKRFCDKSRNITKMILPYFSKITDDCINEIPFYLKEINTLKIKGYSMGMNRNTGITDTAVVNQIIKNNKLQNLTYFSASQIFLERIPKMVVDNSSIKEKLISLKISYLLVNTTKEGNSIIPQLDCIQNLKELQSLQILKLGMIYTQDKRGDKMEVDVPNDISKQIFLGCKNLKQLTIGNWGNDPLLEFISEQQKDTLTKLHVGGRYVTDQGLIQIAQSCENLQILKLKNCSQLEGQFVSHIISRKLQKVTLTLTEYYSELLKEIITTKNFNNKIFQIKTIKLT